MAKPVAGKQVFRPGGILSGQVFTLHDQLLTYRNAYGKYTTVELGKKQRARMNAAPASN